MGRKPGSKNKPKTPVNPENVPVEVPEEVIPDTEEKKNEEMDRMFKERQLEEMKAAIAKAKGYNLSDKIFHLLREEPFFGAISRNIGKTATLQIPTAAVTITPDGYFELLYNPVFMSNLSEQHQIGVLMHEFYHIIFGHLAGNRFKIEKNTMKKWNHATDLAINSIIPERLPDWTLLPGRSGMENKSPEELAAAKKRMGEELFNAQVAYGEILKSLPLHMAAEWYMSKLPDPPEGPGEGQGGGEGGNGQGNGEGGIDDHSKWGEASEEARAIAEERCKSMIGKAVSEAAGGRGFGSVSAECKQQILKRISATIDWKKVLRMFIGGVMRGESVKTIKRLNKKTPYINPGTKRLRIANIGIAVDQSGSVSDELLVKFFSELDHLAELATFTILPFDTEIDPKLIEVWKKGQRHKAKRVKCGGTCFQCVTDYINREKSYDAVIVASDMCAPAPGRCRVPRLWMTTKSDKEQMGWKTTERIMVVDD